MRVTLLAFSLLGILCAAHPVLAAAAPFVRATVTTAGPIVAGQQISVAVEVFAPNFFKSPPQFPLFDIPDAVVTLPQQRGQNLGETIDGVEYAGIRYVYAVVPLAAGQFSLPPDVITFDYADDDAHPVSASVTLPATVFSVSGPSDGQARLAFAAKDVSISQSLDRDPSALKAGETLVRTVTIFAGNSQAMMIPALNFFAPAGVALYQQAPVIADDAVNGDGKSGSTRTTKVTYLLAGAGTFDIPAATLDWFDTGTRSTQTASLPALTLTVAAAPPPAAAATIAPTLDVSTPTLAATRWTKPMLVWGALLAIVLACAAALLLAAPWLRRRIGNWRDRRRQSEPAAFRLLLATLNRNDARVTYLALDAWSSRAGFRTLSDWQGTIANPDLRSEMSALERRLFARARGVVFPINPARLKDDLRRSRDELRRARTIARSRTAALPPLNP